MISRTRRRKGASSVLDAWQKIGKALPDKLSVFSALGGKPWSELQKGSSARWILEQDKEFEWGLGSGSGSEDKAERRY